MNAFDFRAEMMEKVRAFDAWAWKDIMENPDDWDLDSMGFQEWFEMFDSYLQGG